MRPSVRAAAAVLVAIVLVVPTSSAVGPAAAKTRVMPGSFTGYAFDTCDAPSQRKMNAWRRTSSYAGVGIYIAGLNRACKSQPNLTRRWVAAQSRKGWRLLPLVVGPQASCAPKGYYRGKRISAAPAGSYAKARKQGRRAAANGALAARRLGIAKGSVLWYDLEHFDTSDKRCRRSALRFTTAWTHHLHRLGYRSGFYSSASSGITLLDQARRRGVDNLPDYLWVAEWNGRDNLRSSYISRQGWWPHRRVHQFRGGHDERHGGSLINIDSNWMSTGRGTVAGPPRKFCGVRSTFRGYPRLERGDRGVHVKVAQCLLRRQKDYRGKVHGRFNPDTTRAVRRFQDDRRVLATHGRVNARTWTALLSHGDRPLLKVGSGGGDVRRLERALNAATRAGLTVDGVFGKADLRVVRHYQRQRGVPRTGVVTRVTWRPLQRGLVVRPYRAREPVDVAALLSGVQDPGGIPFSSGADRQ